jgi:hypothetical protein
MPTPRINALDCGAGCRPAADPRSLPAAAAVPARKNLIGALSVALALSCATAAVVDRIAVVVGKTVITESEVVREVRLTEFLNQQPLDLGPAARRAAAERLVDQQLIRNEMVTGRYPMPSESEAAAMVLKYRQENYPGNGFHEALQRYGLTEEDLKQHLLWQLAAIRFTDLRFQSGLPPSPGQSANRMQSDAAVSVANPDVDRQLDAWLKEMRTNTRIQFKPGAFQ